MASVRKVSPNAREARGLKAEHRADESFTGLAYETAEPGRSMAPLGERPRS
jgi:hypothetical protein